MAMKLGQYAVAFNDLSTTYMALLNASTLIIGDPDDQEIVLNFWFLLTSAAFNCGLYTNAKEMAEQTESLAQERPKILAQVLRIKRESIARASECVGLCRPHTRIPWDDLATTDNLHSPESVGRLNDITQKLSKGAFIVTLGRFGREMRATRKIKKGEQFPVAPHLSFSYNIDTATICGHCSENIPASVRDLHRCNECGIPFCSPECFEEAMSRYHVPLCGVPVTEVLDWYLSQCTEVPSLMILNILKVFAEAKHKGITPVEVDCVRDLCVNNSPVEYIDPVGLQVFSCILSMLKIETGDPNYEFWHYIGVHQRISANCFGNGDLASGACTTLPGFICNANHDCVRYNAQVNDQIDIVKDIEKDEEVLVCYISETLKGVERESVLLSYNIRCECSICGPNQLNV